MGSAFTQGSLAFLRKSSDVESLAAHYDHSCRANRIVQVSACHHDGVILGDQRIKNGVAHRRWQCPGFEAEVDKSRQIIGAYPIQGERCRRRGAFISAGTGRDAREEQDKRGTGFGCRNGSGHIFSKAGKAALVMGRVFPGQVVFFVIETLFPRQVHRAGEIALAK